MTIFVTALHIIVCLILIVVVLLQRGKGAEIGAVFGGGGGGTMFGARGAGNFLTRLTSGAAVIFMLTSLTLAYFSREDSRSTLFEDNPAAEQSTSPFEEVAPAVEPEAEAGSPFEELSAPEEPQAAEPQAAEPPAAEPGDAAAEVPAPATP